MMSMTTGERYMELRARLQELEVMAEHVPPAALGERLVDVLGEHMEHAGFPVETSRIRERVGKIQEPHGPLDVPYPLGGSWPPPVLPEPKTIAIPQGAPVEEAEEPPDEEPIEESPRDKLLREGYEEMNERQEAEEGAEPGANIPDPIPEELEASGEPGKTCTKCGKTKPLSEFYKNQGKCKPCYIERQRELGHRKKTISPAAKSEAAEVAASPKADGELDPARVCARRRLCLAYPEKGSSAERRPGSIYCPACLAAAGKTVLPSTVAPLPEKEQEPKKEAPARFCANGEECVAYPQLDEPTRMHPSNLDDVCFPCQEARRKFGRTGPVVGHMIVRHSAGEETA